MINDTMSKIKLKIQHGKTINEKTKEQLLDLITKLDLEVTELSKQKKEQAESITGFASLSTHEATKENKNPRLMEISLEGLSSSVKEFEVSHPKLTGIINNISQILANMGI